MAERTDVAGTAQPPPQLPAKSGGDRWAHALKGAQQVVQQQQLQQALAGEHGEPAGISASSAKTAPTKLAVFVRGARNLAADRTGPCDPYAKVYCRGQKAKTDCILNDREPRWEQVCTLEVDAAQLQHATLDVRVKHFTRMPLAKSTLGCLRLQLADVCAHMERYQEPAWYPLAHGFEHGQLNGAEVELQVFVSQERLVGPLSVLCATWNVGNEQPPPPSELLQWLKGCDRQEHHLVVVSAQECNYVRSARRSNSRRATTSSRLGPQEIKQAYSLSAEDVALAEELAANIEHKDHSQAMEAPSRQRVSLEQSTTVAEEGDEPAAGLPAWPPSLEGHPSSKPHSPFSSTSLQSANSASRARALMTQDSLERRPSSNPQSLSSFASLGSSASSRSLQHMGSGNRSSARQQNVLLAQAKRVKDSYDSAAAWEQHIAEALGPRYWMLTCRHMFQTRLLLFARQDVVAAVSSIKTGYEATGIGRVGVNKGGVAVALQLGDTHLAFVGAHLAAHQSKVLTRNADVAEIVHNMPSLGGVTRGGDLLTGFHHTFWMGDLNYRVDHGAQAQTQDDSPSAEDWSAMVQLVQRQSYAELLAGDQLAREVAAGRVLLGFREAPISFPPTFKVTKGEASHIYNPKRSPAWCDRILWRSNLPHKQAQPLLYTSAPDVATSDHKPVVAAFSVPTVEHTAARGRVSNHGRSSTSNKLRLEGLDIVDQASWQACLGPVLAASSKRVRLELHLSGSCLVGRKAQVIHVDTRTLSSAAAASDPRPLIHQPWVLPLLRSSGGTLAGLEDEVLLLRLVVVEGWKRRVLARGVLPLQPAVAEHRDWVLSTPGTARGVAEVAVHMESGSAFAGTIIARLQLVSKGADRIAAGFLQHMMSARRTGQQLQPSLETPAAAAAAAVAAPAAVAAAAVAAAAGDLQQARLQSDTVLERQQGASSALMRAKTLLSSTFKRRGSDQGLLPGAADVATPAAASSSAQANDAA